MSASAPRRSRRRPFPARLRTIGRPERSHYFGSVRPTPCSLTGCSCSHLFPSRGSRCGPQRCCATHRACREDPDQVIGMLGRRWQETGARPVLGLPVSAAVSQPKIARGRRGDRREDEQRENDHGLFQQKMRKDFVRDIGLRTGVMASPPPKRKLRSDHVRRHISRNLGQRSVGGAQPSGPPGGSGQLPDPGRLRGRAQRRLLRSCGIVLWRTDYLQPMDETGGTIWEPAPVRTNRKSNYGSIALRAALLSECALKVFSRRNPSKLNTALRYQTAGRACPVHCISNPKRPPHSKKVRGSGALVTSLRPSKALVLRTHEPHTRVLFRSPRRRQRAGLVGPQCGW
jgi:hypothetical protein